MPLALSQSLPLPLSLLLPLPLRVPLALALPCPGSHLASYETIAEARRRSLTAVLVYGSWMHTAGMPSVVSDLCNSMPASTVGPPKHEAVPDQTRILQPGVAVGLMRDGRTQGALLVTVFKYPPLQQCGHGHER